MPNPLRDQLTSYLTDARTRFAIEASPGSLVDLPRPAEALSASAIPLSSRSARILRNTTFTSSWKAAAGATLSCL